MLALGDFDIDWPRCPAKDCTAFDGPEKVGEFDDNIAGCIFLLPSFNELSDKAVSERPMIECITLGLLVQLEFGFSVVGSTVVFDCSKLA